MVNRDKLIYIISTGQHLLKNYLANQFKNDGIQITPSHAPILFSLMVKNPQTMNELGKYLHIENSTVTGLIDRLEKGAFVQRIPDESDRRKWNISITNKGIKEIKKTQKTVKRVNEMIKEDHTEADMQAFQRVFLSFFDKFAE